MSRPMPRWTSRLRKDPPTTAAVPGDGQNATAVALASSDATPTDADAGTTAAVAAVERGPTAVAHAPAVAAATPADDVNKQWSAMLRGDPPPSL